MCCGDPNSTFSYWLESKLKQTRADKEKDEGEGEEGGESHVISLYEARNFFYDGTGEGIDNWEEEEVATKTLKICVRFIPAIPYLVRSIFY